MVDKSVFNEVNVYGVSFKRDCSYDTSKALKYGYLVCQYKEDLPVDAQYFDRVTGEVKLSQITKGDAVKCEVFFSKKLESPFGIVDNKFLFKVSLRSYWNDEFKLSHWPVKYSVSTIANFNDNGFYKVVSLKINADKHYLYSEQDPRMLYLFKFLETVINELVYFPGYSFSGRDNVWESESYYSCNDRQGLLFWISHIEDLPHGSMTLESLKTGKTFERTGISLPAKPPKWDRSKMEVPGQKLFNVWIKTVNIPGDGILTSKGYLVINFQETPGHAFWVIRYQDYSHFINGDGRFDRSLEDKDHPFWRFYHTPGGYDELEKFAF